jgi:hypothetical protein
MWKFYKVMVMPVLLHGIELWTVNIGCSDETCKIYEWLQ